MIIAAVFSIIAIAGVGGSILSSSVAPSLRSWSRTADRQLRATYPATMRPYLWQ